MGRRITPAFAQRFRVYYMSGRATRRSASARTAAVMGILLAPSSEKDARAFWAGWRWQNNELEKWKNDV